MPRYEEYVFRGKAAAVTGAGAATLFAWTDDEFRLDDIVAPITFGLTAASFRYPHAEHAISGWALTRAASYAGRAGKLAARGASRLLPGVGTALLVYDVLKVASKDPGRGSWTKDSRGFETVYSGDDPFIHMFTTRLPDWIMSSDRVN